MKICGTLVRRVSVVIFSRSAGSRSIRTSVHVWPLLCRKFLAAAQYGHTAVASMVMTAGPAAASGVDRLTRETPRMDDRLHMVAGMRIYGVTGGTPRINLRFTPVGRFPAILHPALPELPLAPVAACHRPDPGHRPARRCPGHQAAGYRLLGRRAAHPRPSGRIRRHDAARAA